VTSLSPQPARQTGAELIAETFLIAFDRRHRYDPDQPNALPWL
jgi:hypothetical protein